MYNHPPYGVETALVSHIRPSIGAMVLQTPSLISCRLPQPHGFVGVLQGPQSFHQRLLEGLVPEPLGQSIGDHVVARNPSCKGIAMVLQKGLLQDREVNLDLSVACLGLTRQHIEACFGVNHQEVPPAIHPQLPAPENELAMDDLMRAAQKKSPCSNAVAAIETSALMLHLTTRCIFMLAASITAS